jgi:hypothetical protein
MNIRETAEPQGYREKLSLKRRTISSAIGAQIYTDVKDNQDSKFIKIKTRPTRFYLRDLPQTYDINLLDNQSIKKICSKSKSYSEYVYTYNSIHTKTVFYENSKKKAAQWQHPDWENQMCLIV